MRLLALLFVVTGTMFAASDSVKLTTSRVHPNSILVLIDGPEKHIAFAVRVPTMCNNGQKGPVLSTTAERTSNQQEPVAATLRIPDGCYPQFVTVLPLVHETPIIFGIPWVPDK